MGPVLLGELEETPVDSVERLVQEVGDRGVRVGDHTVEKELVEVLTTPFGGVFTCMPTEIRSPVYKRECFELLVLQLLRVNQEIPIDSLEHGEISLTDDTSEIIDKRMRVLHRTSALLIPVLGHADSVRREEG